MKFESISVDERKLADFKKNWLPRMKCGGKDFVFLAASTHEPEESIIVDLYREIEKQFGNIRLVLAPRHPQRARAVSDIVSQKGYEPVKLSNFSRQHLKEKDVLLIDSVGKLLYFYSICDICFVGGSLVDTGGHNILEPVYFLKPTMFGPHMANFVDIESAVMEKNAGIRVSGLEDLKAQTIRLLKDPLYRDSFKRKCAEVFDTHINNVENNLQLILQALSRKPENHVSQ